MNIPETPPFYADTFSNYTQFRVATKEWYNEQFVGKKVRFKYDIVGESGETRHEKGKVVVVADYDTAGLFRIDTLGGAPIPGRFRLRCFELIIEYNGAQ